MQLQFSMYIFDFLLMQLQFRKISELFSYAATVFVLPDLILHTFSVEGYSRLVHTARTLGRIAMPRQSSSITTGADNRRLPGVRQDGAGWSVDFHFSPFATKERNWENSRQF